MNMIHAEKLVYEYDKRDEEGNVIAKPRIERKSEIISSLTRLLSTTSLTMKGDKSKATATMAKGRIKIPRQVKS